MSNDPNLEGAGNYQPQPESGAAPEWNGGYAPQPEQTPQWDGGYVPQQEQQPPWDGGYAPQQEQQAPWNGGYAPQQEQQAPWNGGYAPQQPQQPQWNNGYAPQQPQQNAPRQPRAPKSPRTPNPAYQKVMIPGFIPREKLPLIVKVLLCAFTGLMVLLFVNNLSLVNTVWTAKDAMKIIAGLLALGGGVRLALGPILKKPRITAIGCFETAAGVLIAGIGYVATDSYSLRWMDVIGGVFVILSSFALVVVGLNYLLKGQVVNALVKRIACFAGFGLAALGIILTVIPALDHAAAGMRQGYVYAANVARYSILFGIMTRGTINSVTGVVTGTTLWLIFILLGLAAVTIGLFLYNPEMQEFQGEEAQAKKEPAPVWPASIFAKIAPCVFIGATLIALVFSCIAFRFVPFFSLLMWLIAGVMMALGALLNRKSELLFAIGVFAAAVGSLAFMYADSWYVSPFLFIQFLCLLGVGAYYLTRRRVLNDKIKMIMTFVGAGIGLLANLFHVIMMFVDTNAVRSMYGYSNTIRLDVVVLFLHLFVLFSTVLLFVAIFFYQPFTKPAQRAPKQPRPAQAYGGYQQGYSQPNPYGQGMPTPPQGYPPQQPVQNPLDPQGQQVQQGPQGPQGGQYY